MDARRFLAGTSFLAAGGGEGALPGLSVWGGGSWRSLSQDDDGLDRSGELWSLRFGADMRPHPQWLAGLSVDVSESRFEWSAADPDGGQKRSGDYELDMMGVWPYAGWVSRDRSVRAWGLVGYGTGEVRLEEDGADGPGQRSDVSMVSAALGASRSLWRSGGLMLSAKAEFSLAEMELEGNAGSGGLLAPLSVSAQRARLGLEASHERALAGGGRLVPSLALAARDDFGDGEGASGLEAGAGLRLSDPGSGVSAEGRGHALVLSGEDGAEEWGLDLVARYDPGLARRGPALDLRTGYGASGGAGRLWEQEAAALSSSGAFEPEARLDARLGYGLMLGGNAGLLTPYGGVGLAGAGARDARLGASWERGERLGLALEAAHRESAGGGTEQRALLTARAVF